MKKFILSFILSILSIVFVVFLYNAFILQKNYFDSKVDATPESEIAEVLPTEIPSRYINYTKDEYDKALLEKRVTVLFFTSNWCSSCTNQDLVNKSVFDTLKTQGVVGLNIHILDSETTTETTSLSKKFDVTKENTIVILDKNGAVGFKYVGEITKELLKSKIQEVIDK